MSDRRCRRKTYTWHAACPPIPLSRVVFGCYLPHRAAEARSQEHAKCTLRLLMAGLLKRFHLAELE